MCNDLDTYFKPIVMVTGFGPFINHPVNASWEAVKLMDKQALEARHGIELVQLELPVTYSNVDEFVPALWETHDPKLMIHVGVSSAAQCVTLETQAHRKGYSRLDYLDETPAGHACPARPARAAPAGPGAARLRTELDVQRICDDFNATEDISAVTSCDAGRYLCEYIYYTSLSTARARTLFVHVPELRVLGAARAARALERVLALCLAQMAERERAAAAPPPASPSPASAPPRTGEDASPTEGGDASNQV